MQYTTHSEKEVSPELAKAGRTFVEMAYAELLREIPENLKGKLNHKSSLISTCLCLMLTEMTDMGMFIELNDALTAFHDITNEFNQGE